MVSYGCDDDELVGDHVVAQNIMMLGHFFPKFWHIITEENGMLFVLLFSIQF